MARSFSWIRRRVEPIGIDIGRRCIRMLQLARHKDQISILAAAQHTLPPGNLPASELDSLRIQAIRDMLKTGGFSGREAVTALSWDELQFRNLRIPSMPPEDMEQAVSFEAAERMGLDPEETEVRFTIAGDVRQGTETRQEVLVFGAPRNIVDTWRGFFDKCGLQLVALDAGACGLFRGFERYLRRDEDSNEVNVFLDLGYTGARVIVSRGRNLIFVKAIPIGGQQFDQLAADALSLDLTTAADLRLRITRRHIAMATQQPLNTDDGITDELAAAVNAAIKPSLEQLGKEIALCLRYCSVTFRGIRSDSVTALGGEAYNADMLAELSQHAHVPVHMGRPMRNVTADKDFAGADRRTGMPDWAMALGLALKPVDQPEAVAV